MSKEKQIKKKSSAVAYESIYSKMLPLFFIVISLLIIILPLQKSVNSARAVLSYIFVPQLRAAHSAAQYLKGVTDSVDDLISAAAQNNDLKEEIAALKIENAQVNVLRAENERISNIINISPQLKWHGVWAKVAYREPSRFSTLIVDKGANDGVGLRAPVIGADGGLVGLVGKVVEVGPKTAKILLSSDEDFFAAAFLSDTRIEGLAAGNGRGGLNIKYIPLEAPVKEGEKVYTSASSAIFPDGILIGEIKETDTARSSSDAAASTFLMPSIKPAIDPGRIKEVLILMPMDSPIETIKGGKK